MVGGTRSVLRANAYADAGRDAHFTIDDIERRFHGRKQLSGDKGGLGGIAKIVKHQAEFVATHMAKGIGSFDGIV